MRNLLLGIGALVGMLIAGSLWWLHNSLDAQVASAIRQYGPAITAVPISLSKVTINPLDGKAALYGLVIRNPDGFKTKQALALGEISVTLDIGSLTTDVIRIKELTLIKPEITYEYVSGTSNLDVLQQNIERSVGQERRARKTGQNSESGKKLVIEHLYIKDGTIRMSAEFLNGDAIPIPITALHLQSIGEKSNGATAAEAAQQILASVIHQVGISMASHGVNFAGKTIREGVETATKRIKDFFK